MASKIEKLACLLREYDASDIADALQERLRGEDEQYLFMTENKISTHANGGFIITSMASTLSSMIVRDAKNTAADIEVLSRLLALEFLEIMQRETKKLNQVNDDIEMEWDSMG